MDERTLSIRNGGPLPRGTMPRLKAELRDYRYRTRIGVCRLLRCSCGALWNTNPGPMLHNHLWARIARSKSEFLCDPCTRRRLGRPPTRYDLRDCAFNFGWFGEFWTANWRWVLGRFRRTAQGRTT